jgi:CubicO group peptidase (beta-lactamase class C family)
MAFAIALVAVSSPTAEAVPASASAQPAFALSDSQRSAVLKAGADKLLAATVTANGPGVAVMIARADTVIYRNARGSADIELGVPLKPDQVFSIASVTKMFTAATILKLAEQGKLSLDDPLTRYLPGFPSELVTLRQLLSHTAGISDKVPPADVQPGALRRDFDMATSVALIAKRPRDFAAGSDQSYSNAGFILLGAVIEKVTGKRWYEAEQDLLFTPLGLRHTGYAIASNVIAGRVRGYTTDPLDHSVRNASYISMTVPASAGGLASTLDDLRVWMRALATRRVLNVDDYRQMTTPVVPPGKTPSHPYGFGMYVWSVRGETMIGHVGQINGFASILAYLPARDITIVALGNDDNFDAQNFGRRLAAIAIGKPYPAVVSVPISASDLNAFAGSYQEGTEVRTLLVKDGKLYTHRGAGADAPLQMTATGELHFVPDELAYFKPVRDAAGKIIRLDDFEHGDGPPKALPRLSKNLSAQARGK